MRVVRPVLDYEIKQVQENAAIQHFYPGFYPEYVSGNQFLKYFKGCLHNGTAFCFPGLYTGYAKSTSSGLCDNLPGRGLSDFQAHPLLADILHSQAIVHLDPRVQLSTQQFSYTQEFSYT